jgi:phosphoglycerate kinase
MKRFFDAKKYFGITINKLYIQMKTLDQFNFSGKRAVIRVDFNVPLNADLQITDDTRIQAAAPTVKYILENGGSCVLMSHLGRPKGSEDKFSLKHIVAKVSEVMGTEVIFADNCIGEETVAKAEALKPGQILLVENLRFHSEEKNGDVDFAKELAKLGDIYVNDAFGTAHRAHASTTIIAQFFPEDKCFGKLLAKEIESINKVLKEGEHPITAVLGGAKVSSKITIIETMLDTVDNIIIGGGMVFTFAKAQGGNIGGSLVEDDKLELALDILKKAEAKGVKILLPSDAVAADKFAADANTQVCPTGNIPEGWMGLDAGPESLKEIKEVILASKTILWNGPMGVFEMEAFANGTIQLGEFISESTANGAFSLVGGGDSVAAVKQFGFADKVSYVSTGGGAMLESLEGKLLPGIAAIME